MKKEIFYMGDNNGTYYFTLEDGNMVGSDITKAQLNVFLVYAKRLGFNVGKL